MLAVSLALGLALSGDPQERPVIRSAAEAPAYDVRLSSLPSEAFLSPGFMEQTVPGLRQEAERLLSDYDIQDPVVASRLRSGLAAIAILEDRPDDARRLIGELRASETKPQLQAIGFLLGDGIAASDPVGECAAAADHIAALLGSAAPEVIREEVLVRYARIQVASPAYYAGTAVGAVDPIYQTKGSLDLLQGIALVHWRMEALTLPPCREPIAAALSAWLNDPAHQPRDIWAERAVSSAEIPDPAPVVVAIWDSGFDVSLFADRLAFDPAEPLDGRDNDGNGVVDDVHGPTFDYRLMPTSYPYPMPSSFMASRLGLQYAVEKGDRDLSYGLDTPEARFFAERGRNASASEQGDDVLGAAEFGGRSHGTAVSSIIARDAPWVRLYNVYALPWGEFPRRMPYSEPEISRWASLVPAIGARMKGAGVRVVNMSWLVDAAGFADALVDSGLETDRERALVRGQAMYDEIVPALRAMMEASPDILFVVGAGNSNQADEVLAAAPQSFGLPNMIVVGATAATGRATTFTTFGPSIDLYGLGENIQVTVPGGQTMRGQGTSYASPFVVHAAAAMLAANPALSPAEVVEGLTSTATLNDAGLKLVNEAEAVRWAAERR